jgi:hypothetical protein
MTFLAGMLGGIVPGLVFGTVLFTVLGWFVARDSYCRHRYSEPAPQPVAAPGPVRVSADRVPAAPVPVVVNVFIPGLPQPAPVMWPNVVEGQVVHELPPARWGN